jgi:acetoin utilization deacetylase AcuC-like enzyme
VTAVVIALGVDAAAGASQRPPHATAAGLRAASRDLGGMGPRTVLAHEGGDDLTTIGALAAETLAGVQEGATRA